MDTGVRRFKHLALVDRDGQPIKATIKFLVFPGPPPRRVFEAGLTERGERLRQHGEGAYITDGGDVLVEEEGSRP